MTQWTTAYREHSPALLSYLGRRLRRRDEAEDLLQETFLRAARAEGTLRNPGRLRSWLFSIAHNVLVNHLRRRSEVVVLESDLGVGQGPVDPVAPSHESPEAAAEFRDLRERLERAQESMTPVQRTAFRLAILEQLSYGEIADRTGWSRAQVKINVFRARKKAITALGKSPYGDEGR